MLASSLLLACTYIWSQQSADGGWHSQTYGLLRSGQSLTPFVLNIVLERCSNDEKKVGRALTFMKKQTKGGGLGLADHQLHDYPTYSTALAVIAIIRAGRPGSRQTVEPMLQWLRNQQLTEQHGWKPGDAAYGGWGMGGVPRIPPDAGHVDLSMTRYVIQAFVMAGVPTTDPALAKARVFVERCQNEDGGFLYSPVVLSANKAGHGKSYGSTTADGILALEALGLPTGRPKQFLEEYQLPDERWAIGLLFYYAAARKDAIGRSDVQLPAQRPDGSFQNPETFAKEDDPLVATAFAIKAWPATLLPR